MKKTLSIVLAVVLSLGMLAAIPFSANAAEELPTATTAPKNKAGLDIGAVAEAYAPAAGWTAIATAEDFVKYLGEGGSAINMNGNYYLTADIDLTTVSYLAKAEYFTGNFDGCGYKVKTNKPLFVHLMADGEVNVIKNLTIDANIESYTFGDYSPEPTGAMRNGTYNVGALAGRASTAQAVGSINKFENIKLTGSVTGWKGNAENYWYTGGMIGNALFGFEAEDINIAMTKVTGQHVGGLVGCFQAGAAEPEWGSVVIKNVYNSSEITNEGCINAVGADINVQSTAAGLVGWFANCAAKIENCENSGKITALASGGGILGRLPTAGGHPGIVEVKNCVNFGDVNRISEDNFDQSYAGAAGIVGFDQGKGTEYKNCTNYGDVTAAEAGYTGGIVGPDKGAKILVDGCVNYGDIKTADCCAGGITAYTGKASTYRNCKNYGDVESIEGAGGISGWGKKAAGYTIEKCENHGNITVVGTKQAYAGGIVSVSIAATINDCANFGKIESKITGEKKSYVSAIVGGASATVETAEEIDPVTGLLVEKVTGGLKITKNFAGGELAGTENAVIAAVVNGVGTVKAIPVGEYFSQNTVVNGLAANVAGFSTGTIVLDEDYSYAVDAENPETGDNTVIISVAVVTFAALLGSAVVLGYTVSKKVKAN